MISPERIQKILAELRQFQQSARKLWREAGFDSQKGLFREGLLPDGMPAPLMKHRFRVQCRQIYVFAQSYVEHFDPEDLNLAEAAWTACQADFRIPGKGGYYSAIDTEGAPLPEIDLYEQAFAIFAAVWLFHITQNESYLRDAEAVWSFIEAEMSDPAGGFFPTLPFASRQAQNPHMHLLEACLFAYMFTAGSDWEMRAKTLLSLFTDHIYDAENRVVREHFKAGWGLDSNGTEPGHSGEWIWLLHVCDSILDSDTYIFQRALYDRLLLDGLDIDGLGWDEIEAEGGVRRHTRRLWVQCEIIKGHLAIFEQGTEFSVLERTLSLIETVQRLYLRGAENGTWNEHLDAHGKNFVNFSPATSFYHLNLMIQEVIRVLEPISFAVNGCAGCPGKGAL